MAKPRLKVFRAQMGFAEAIVAALSQKAALAALEQEATIDPADFARRREQLEAEELRLLRDLDTRRGVAQGKLDQARRAYEAA